MTVGPIWSETVAIEDVPEGGLHVDIEADPHTRSALARAAGLRELKRLHASFDVERQGPRALHISGEVSATVGQNCVVTLEPVESELNETVDLVFAPGTQAREAMSGRSATVGFEEAEPPEPMIGWTVDLGAVATEFFLLGIEPYPRKEGAVFEQPVAPEDAAARPFAALEALKKRDPGSGT